MAGTFHGYGNMRAVVFLFSCFPMVPHATSSVAMATHRRLVSCFPAFQWYHIRLLPWLWQHMSGWFSFFLLSNGTTCQFFRCYVNLWAVAFLFSCFSMVPHANFLPTQPHFPRNTIFRAITFSMQPHFPPNPILPTPPPTQKAATLQILNL